MKVKITTIGDAMKDIFVFPAMEEMEGLISKNHEKFLAFGYGDKITISDIHYDIGGTACNVAVGLAKLGLKTGIISTVGKDVEGAEIIQTLKKSGVDTGSVKINLHKKTSFSVIISYKGERSILVFHSFTPEDFQIPEQFDTEWLYVGPLGEGYRPLYSKIISFAAEKNLKIALNPGAVQIHDGHMAFEGLLRVTKILFVNKEEGQKLAGISGVAKIDEIMKGLLRLGPEIVVVTDGGEGAYAARGAFGHAEFFKVGAYPANRIETTGAGDSFAVGFIVATIQGEELFTCLKWGVTNAASVIEKYGAQQGLLGLGALKRRVKEYKWPASTLRFS